MTDLEKYTLFSKTRLLSQDRRYILNKIERATLAWDANVNEIETLADGFRYTLTCTKLTQENINDLKQYGLNLEFVPKISS